MRWDGVQCTLSSYRLSRLPSLSPLTLCLVTAVVEMAGHCLYQSLIPFPTCQTNPFCRSLSVIKLWFVSHCKSCITTQKWDQSWTNKATVHLSDGPRLPGDCSRFMFYSLIWSPVFTPSIAALEKEIFQSSYTWEFSKSMPIFLRSTGMR